MPRRGMRAFLGVLKMREGERAIFQSPVTLLFS
jgi:hypothetical protein